MYSVFGHILWKSHPTSPHRHVIAYDSVVILLPMTLAGVSVGVYLNKVGRFCVRPSAVCGVR